MAGAEEGSPWVEACARTATIWPEMAESVEVAAASVTQLRWIVTVGGALPVGLDYGAVHLVAAALGVRWTAELLADVRAVEAGIVDYVAAEAGSR